MDPTTLYHLGQIRQKELLDSCLRDQLGNEIKPRSFSLWQRVRGLVSTVNTRVEQREQPAYLRRSEIVPTSR